MSTACPAHARASCVAGAAPGPRRRGSPPSSPQHKQANARRAAETALGPDAGRFRERRFGNDDLDDFAGDGWKSRYRKSPKRPVGGERRAGAAEFKFLRGWRARRGVRAPTRAHSFCDSVYLTVALSDIKDEKIELTSTLLTFRGKSEGKEYTLSLEFMYAVLPEVRLAGATAIDCSDNRAPLP